jgi:pilus assembly protein Flp/PilA
MSTFPTRIRNLLVEEAGPTAVEYAVMLALILLAGFVAYTSFGSTVSTTFSAATAAAGAGNTTTSQ